MPRTVKRRETLRLAYTCKQCFLVFLAEEIPHRFDDSAMLCARCALRKESPAFIGPPCFGKRYSGGSEACSNVCSLKEPCLIQTTDGHAIKWSLEADRIHRRSTNGGLPLIQQTIRIIRSFGGPIHLLDIAPLLQKITNYRFTMQANKMWIKKISIQLRRSRDIVTLGDGYFMWMGLWQPEMEGRAGCDSMYREAEGLIPIEKIFEEETDNPK